MRNKMLHEFFGSSLGAFKKMITTKIKSHIRSYTNTCIENVFDEGLSTEISLNNTK